jgi:hypothetical protein
LSGISSKYSRRPACKKAGLPVTTRIHDLRHSYASQLLQQKESPVYLQRQLGHANAAITLRVYAHLVPGETRVAARTLEERLGLAEVTVGNSSSHTGTHQATLGKRGRAANPHQHTLARTGGHGAV